MDAPKYRSILLLFLIAVLCASLANVQMARADGETPTEPPAPTEVEMEPPVVETAPPTEPPVIGTDVPTEAPVVETPIPEETPAVPEEATETPVAEVLAQIPEDTDVVVLDENGEEVALVSEEATEIVGGSDPIWCPAGETPDSPNCSQPYATIAALLRDMRENPSFYEKDGVIYFTSTSSGSFILSSQGGSLGTSYDLLKSFNLTLQGGWNGSTDDPSFSEQTDFANNRISIGTVANPWVGNLVLNDLEFSGGNTTLVSIYTTEGDITLDNVDITGQSAAYIAALDSDSGDITVQDSTFAGTSDGQSRGFYAITGGNISISDTSFTGAGTRNTTRYDGATLNAPVVTLTNVTATDNDGSGLFVTGSRLIIVGGTFANNRDYGIEAGASTTIYIQLNPTCTGNGINCFNKATTFDNTAPVITPSVNGATEVESWYGGAVTVNWSVADAESGILSSDCPSVTLNTPTAGTTVTCSATNNAGLSSSTSVTIRIDTSAPVITPIITGAAEVNGWYGGDVTVNWSVADAESGILSSDCPAVTLTAETTGTTLTCSATNHAGLSNSAAVTIRIDTSGPDLSVSDISVEATGPAGAAVSYSVSAVDSVDGPVPASCSPLSGSTFPLGVTTVTCSAADLKGNTNSESFLIAVNDSTAPVIEPLPDISISTYHKFGKHVFYPDLVTSDIVDGAGVATCSPASGSLFPVGNTQVTCTVTDAHGNTATSAFTVHVNLETVVAPTPEPPDSSVIVIPPTGGELIDLGEDSVFWAFGIQLSFINLGDQQTTIHEVKAENLPAKLPAGYSFVMGISVDVLTDGKLLKELPEGAELQLNFPMAGKASDQFAILYWNGSQWIEISEQIGNDQLPQILSVTSDQPGIFVLVKK